MAIRIEDKPLLRDRTTLRLGGEAVAEIVVETGKDLDELQPVLERIGGKPFVLGRGSNILAKDEGLPFTLLRADSRHGPASITGNEGRDLYRAGAGLGLPGVLGWMAKKGLSGLESLAGIPGTVGGAVAMNAGSYGTDVSKVLNRARIWTPRSGLVWRDAADLTMGYRSFDHGLGGDLFLVWEVEFKAEKSTPEAVKRAMRETFARKKATQPVTARTAGCVFKNPEGDSAGRMLDVAGMKGQRLGGMGFSSMHANFLENLGGGTSAQALELMDMARDRVRTEFGVELETEVVVIPWQA